MLRFLLRALTRRPTGDVGFTDHAVQRMCLRTGVTGRPDQVRRELARLAASEGRLERNAPRWARLRDAPAYLIIGDWLCLPVHPSRGHGSTWDATTVVCRQDACWEDAIAHGWVRSAPRGVRVTRRRQRSRLVRLLSRA